MRILCVLLVLAFVVLGAANGDRTVTASQATLSGTVLAGAASEPGQTPDKLVYADFEEVKDNRPVSNRGGFIQLFGGQEYPAHPSLFVGMEGANPPAPQLVRLKKDDPNRAAAFDYTLQAPNGYANVTLEIHGQPDQDGKQVADDVSGYKFVSLQAYATGVRDLRLEMISRDHGIKLSAGYPQIEFHLRPGFNTYRIPLNTLSQPTWVSQQVKTKEVLKNLTSVAISVFCNQCVLLKGQVVIDNVVFEN